MRNFPGVVHPVLWMIRACGARRLAVDTIPVRLLDAARECRRTSRDDRSGRAAALCEGAGGTGACPCGGPVCRSLPRGDPRRNVRNSPRRRHRARYPRHGVRVASRRCPRSWRGLRPHAHARRRHRSHRPARRLAARQDHRAAAIARRDDDCGHRREPRRIPRRERRDIRVRRAVRRPAPLPRRHAGQQRRGNRRTAPGRALHAVNEAALGPIRAAGLGDAIRHRIGHGMGIEGHEAPWLAPGDETRIDAGMVFSNEPGIYRPGIDGYRTINSMIVCEPVWKCPAAFSRTILGIAGS